MKHFISRGDRHLSKLWEQGHIAIDFRNNLGLPMELRVYPSYWQTLETTKLPRLLSAVVTNLLQVTESNHLEIGDFQVRNWPGRSL